MPWEKKRQCSVEEAWGEYRAEDWMEADELCIRKLGGGGRLLDRWYLSNDLM